MNTRLRVTVTMEDLKNWLVAQMETGELQHIIKLSEVPTDLSDGLRNGEIINVDTNFSMTELHLCISVPK